MSKQQLAWLLVRVAGVYFAYCALVSFVPLGASVPDLFTLPKLDKKAEIPVPFDPSKPMPGIGQPAPTPEVTKEQEAAEKEFRAASLKKFLINLGKSIFFLLLAWYFIRDGRVIFEVLSREEPFGLKKDEEEVTALNLSDDLSGKEE